MATTDYDKLGAQVFSAHPGASPVPSGGPGVARATGKATPTPTPADKLGLLGSAPAPYVPPVPPPVQDFLTKVGNVLETPMAAIGADQMDYLRARKQGATPTQALAHVLRANYQPDANQNTSIQHALKLINAGKLSEAADLYSTTSIIANKQRAALGDHLAQWFQQHPIRFAAATIPEEFANPANAALGEFTSALGKGIARAPIPTLNRFKAARDAARRAAQQRAEAPATEVARRTQAQTGRYDVRGENVPGSVKGFIKDPQARARAELDFRQKQQESARMQAANAAAARRAANTPKLPAAPSGPARLMLPPGQAAARALAPAESVTAAGEARLALPSPREPVPETAPAAPATAAVKPLPTETYQDYIARRGGPALSPEEREAANADWQATWPEGTKPPVVDKPSLIARIRAATSPPGKASAKAQVGPVVPQPSLGAGERPPERLAPGKQPGTPVRPQVPMAYDPDQPLVPSGPSPKQGPFRYDLSPEDAADEAEITLRKIAESKDIRRTAQDEVHALGKGLTLKQGQMLVDAIERTIPEGNWAPRIARYRDFQKKLSQDLVDYQVAEPGEIRLAQTYVPRLGSTLDPEDLALESEAVAGAPHEYYHTNVRKGTLAKDRRYQTFEEARHSGAKMDPAWDFLRTLETTIMSRLESIKINKGLTRLRELGLMTYKDEPVPHGWVKLDDTPTLRNFGSKILRESAFPPEIAKALTDITVRETSLNPSELLPTPFNPLAKAGSWVNWATARWQVAAPQYHGIFNLVPTQLATMLAHAETPLAAAKSLAAYSKEMVTVPGGKNMLDSLRRYISGQGREQAVEAGATSPFASDIPAFRMTRPWHDLNPEERWQRVKDLSGRGIENVTSRALYQTMEPIMASATHKGLMAGGMPSARAALRVRQTIGEPENIPGQARSWAQWLMFPGWRLAMGRLWPWLLGKSPALYTGPQRAGRAYNISRGAYNTELGMGDAPPLTSSQHLIPDLMIGRDKDGQPLYLSLPSAANLPLSVMNMIPVPNELTSFSNRAANLATTAANPILATGMRGLETIRGRHGFAGTGPGGYRLSDLDAPGSVGQKLLEALGATGSRYAPVPIPPDQNALLEMLGPSVRSVPSGYMQNYKSQVEAQMRSQIQSLRANARTLAQQGDQAGANELSAQADLQYATMVEYMKELGILPKP